MSKRITVIIDKVLGENNITPPYELATVEPTQYGTELIVNTYLQQCINIDIDDQHNWRRRRGSESIYEGDIHSIWSANDYCLFREGDALKRLQITSKSPLTVSVSILRSGLTIAKISMNYLSLDKAVYYSDGMVSGVIENGISRSWGATLTTAIANLEPPPPGTFLFYFNTRVYAGQYDKIWYSEINGYEYFDLENSYLQLESPISVILPLKDGIWIITQNKTWFFDGGDVPFAKDEKANYGAIEGSGIILDEILLGDKVQSFPTAGGKSSQRIAMWTSTNGHICMGGNGGLFRCLTEKTFATPNAPFGTGLLKQDRGISQYLVSLRNPSSEVPNIYN